MKHKPSSSLAFKEFGFCLSVCCSGEGSGSGAWPAWVQIPSSPVDFKSLGKLNALCIRFIICIYPLACIYLGPLFALEESGDGTETSLAVYWLTPGFHCRGSG